MDGVGHYAAWYAPVSEQARQARGQAEGPVKVMAVADHERIVKELVEALRKLVTDLEICSVAGDPIAYDGYREAVALIAKYTHE